MSCSIMERDEGQVNKSRGNNQVRLIYPKDPTFF